MIKIKYTAAAPATLPEGDVKAGADTHVPERRAAELVGLGWAEYDGDAPAEFVPTPMYASSQPPAKAKAKADAPATDAKK